MEQSHMRLLLNYQVTYMKTAFIYQLINLLHKWCYSSLLMFYAQPREIHGESLQFNIQR